MITGITTLVDHTGNVEKFPFDLAIRSWADVCDEIVVVINKNPVLIDRLVKLSSKVSIPLKFRSIMRPVDHNVFRMFGLWSASNPDWVVHFDTDYLISPSEAEKLKKTIKTAPENTELITYQVVNLTKNGRGIVYNKDVAHWVPPFDGIRGEYPFVLNPRQGMFNCPFEGFRENRNQYINFEGCISLSREHWGMGIYPKDTQGHNPYLVNMDGLRIVRSGVNVEHLTFSLSTENLRKKLNNEYWKILGIDEKHVTEGQGKYDVSYPILEEFRTRSI